MHKWLLLFLIGFCGCASTHHDYKSEQIVKAHMPPFKVYQTGLWNSEYEVYTLTDSKNDYFIIVAPKIDSLKQGSIYYPDKYLAHE